MIPAAFVVFFCGKALIGHATRGFSLREHRDHAVQRVHPVPGRAVLPDRPVHGMVAGDGAGRWFDANSYKRTQGLRVRRLTMLGILLVAGSGVWTMMNHNFCREQ